jgi:hypothetical protein
MGPLGVASSRGGNLYVLDGENRRLERWRQIGSLEAILYGGSTFPTAGSAKLTGMIYPNGAPTTYQIQWGLEGSGYENQVPVPAANVGSGQDPVFFEKTISGLKPETNYHARLVANSTEGSVTSNDNGFKTPDWPPTVTTASAQSKATEATLTGWVNPNGTSTRYNFEWGKNPKSYSNATTMISVGSGLSNEYVTATINSLTPETVYHYRIHADNQRGDQVWGNDSSFVTPPGTMALKSSFSFPEPAGIATEFGSFLLVAYPRGSDVLELTPEGGFVVQIGKPGSGPGQLSAPLDVAVDETGYPEAVVLDTGNNRVERFKTWLGSGAFVSGFGSKGSLQGSSANHRRSTSALNPKFSSLTPATIGSRYSTNSVVSFGNSAGPKATNCWVRRASPPMRKAGFTFPTPAITGFSSSAPPVSCLPSWGAKASGQDSSSNRVESK